MTANLTGVKQHDKEEREIRFRGGKKRRRNMVKKKEVVTYLCNKMGCNWNAQKPNDITRGTHHASLISRDPSGFKKDEVRKIAETLQFSGAQVNSILDRFF